MNPQMVQGNLHTSRLIWGAKIWTVQDTGPISFSVHIPPLLLNPFGHLVDVGGEWMTPGLVDLHLHVGVMSAPSFNSGY